MHQRRLAVAVRALLCLALAGLALHHAKQMPLEYVAPHTIAMQATILECIAYGEAQNLIIEDAQGYRYTTFTNTDQADCAPGNSIFVSGILRSFEAARNPGAFSEQTLAQLRGYTAAIDRPHMRLLAYARQDIPRFWPARFRIWASNVLASRLPSDETALLTGMLWGDHHALDQQDTAAFSTTGTSHLLVTAGLHLGFFVGATRLILRVLTIQRTIAASMTLILTWCICIISDAHLPSVRAATMLSAFLCAECLGTQSDARRTLGYALLLAIITDPSALADTSFYLSFSCVFAIMHLAQSVEAYLKARKMPSIAAKAFAVTIAAQIGTWALIAAAFHQISCIAPLANCFAIPLALIALGIAPCVLLATAMHCCFILSILVTPLHVLLQTMLIVVRTCAHLPLAAITVRAPAFWTIICYECALVVGCCMCTDTAALHMIALTQQWQKQLTQRQQAVVLAFAFKKKLRTRIACALILIASACVFCSAVLTPRQFCITMLDVGQGDGIVIETPHGHTILIDTGGRLELHVHSHDQSPSELAAARVLLPFLQYKGITHIDVLLLTHPHGDHVGGAAPVLRSLPVHLFLDSGQAYPGIAYQDALHEAAYAHVRRVVGRRGDVITLDDGIALHILAPTNPLFVHGQNDINENSIVAMLTYRHFRMLFTGDAGMQAEQRLLLQGDDLHADILKVGHHGSAYASSTAFLRVVHPRLALISVGRHNLFHHPAAATLARLQAAGIHVYRTDQCGAITVDATGAVTTMLPCT